MGARRDSALQGHRDADLLLRSARAQARRFCHDEAAKARDEVRQGPRIAEKYEFRESRGEGGDAWTRAAVLNDAQVLREASRREPV